MKFVIFDIDGTLTDTKSVEDKCFKSAFQEVFDIDISQQNWADLKHVTDWGITEEIIEREQQRQPSVVEYQQMIQIFTQKLELIRQNDPNQFLEVRGAKAFFHHLQQQVHIELGIATGSWEQSALIKLDQIGISPRGHAFSNSDYHKSRENIVRDSIQQLEAKVKQEVKDIVYFGDGVWDFKTCQNLGIRFIGIDILGDNKLLNLGAKWVFRDYSDQKAIIDVIYS